MKTFWCLLYLCQAVLAGNLYSPTSYAYPSSTLVAPQPISALHYASPLRTSTGYGPLAAARFGSVAAAPVLAPAAYAAPAAPFAPVIPAAYSAPVAPLVTRYAAPVIQKFAAVPAVADVPITRYEAQPGFIQKYVDVAHPKIATRKIQIRRPAIQKQFYDIEERIVVRPIASAVVELDQPLSKSQAGPTLISPAVPAGPGIISAAPIPIAPLPPIPTYGPPQPLPPPSAPENPQFLPPSAPQNPQLPPPLAPQGPNFPETSASGSGQESDDSDSITVENEEARARTNMQERAQVRQLISRVQLQEENQRQNEQAEQQPEQVQSRSGLVSPARQEIMTQTEARFLSRSQVPIGSFNDFAAQSRFASQNIIPSSRSQLSDVSAQSRLASQDIIPSSRSQLTEEQSQSNQQRLIELLTGRGGIAEVRSGISIDATGETGQIRGRVLSVTPAPPSSGPADERVSTRRIIVSRPIQTLQEVDVIQPFTKLQRLSVQHPAILKTPRVDIARINTYAPVQVAQYGSYSPYTLVH